MYACATLKTQTGVLLTAFSNDDAEQPIYKIDAIKDEPEERTTQPIKDVDQILRVQGWFIRRKKWRENLLFMCGVKLGLRISDLLDLRIKHLYDEEGNVNRKIRLVEQKTKNTRKQQKVRVMYVNDAVKQAAELYYRSAYRWAKPDPEDYLFYCQSNNGIGKPLTPEGVRQLLAPALHAAGVKERFGTHGMRKTFGYHVYMDALQDAEDPKIAAARALHTLMEIFGHSSEAITLRYIGIGEEERKKVYMQNKVGYMEEAEIAKILNGGKE